MVDACIVYRTRDNTLGMQTCAFDTGIFDQTILQVTVATQSYAESTHPVGVSVTETPSSRALKRYSYFD